ncbi:hypothetical protein BJV78DRAFT_1172951 [Lactifluus subvellereus]|nr:hypothetical protein BJV78DRAFT_1172951 [Lactifluus subvellereus]
MHVSRVGPHLQARKVRRYLTFFGVALLLHLVRVIIALARVLGRGRRRGRGRNVEDVDGRWRRLYAAGGGASAGEIGHAAERGEKVRLERDLRREDFRVRDQLLRGGIWTGRRWQDGGQHGVEEGGGRGRRRGRGACRWFGGAALAFRERLHPSKREMIIESRRRGAVCQVSRQLVAIHE